MVFIPTFWGWKPLVVVSGSMEPTLKVGGILYYHEESMSDFDTGDILVYDIPEHTISHRIVEISDYGFTTKGDANNSVDSNLVEYNQVKGRGTNWSIPFIGYYANFIYAHKYLLFISVAIITIDLANDFYKDHKRKVVENEKEKGN
jgi:signal peptidase